MLLLLLPVSWVVCPQRNTCRILNGIASSIVFLDVGVLVPGIAFVVSVKVLAEKSVDIIYYFWRHNILNDDTQNKDIQRKNAQHDDTQNNDTQRKNNQYSDIQHNDTQVTTFSKRTQHRNKNETVSITLC